MMTCGCRCAHTLLPRVARMVACSNANCDQIPEQYCDPRRRLGRLYAEPTVRCRARTLPRPLACQTCGEAFLGGYCATDPRPPLPTARPSRARRGAGPSNRDRTHTRYKLFWPTDRGRSTGTGKGQRELQVPFADWHLDPFAGTLDVGDADRRAPNGWLYTIRANNADAAPLTKSGPADRCPNCGDDREFRTHRERAARSSASHESRPDAHAAVADACQRGARQPDSSQSTFSKTSTRARAARRVLGLAPGRRNPVAESTRATTGTQCVQLVVRALSDSRLRCATAHLPSRARPAARGTRRRLIQNACTV